MAVFSHIPKGIPRVAGRGGRSLLRAIPFPGAVALLDPGLQRHGGFCNYPGQYVCYFDNLSLFSLIPLFLLGFTAYILLYMHDPRQAD